MHPPQIHNIGIFAHIDAGKTTFVERLLYESGQIYHPGSIDEGTTEMDTLPEEIARGISITSATTQLRYKYKKETHIINIIDTPGHLDFHSQVDSALLAVDIAVLLIDITTGIRSQTEMIAEKLTNANLPIIIFLNKLDKNPETYYIQEEIISLFPKKITPLYHGTERENIHYIFSEKEIDEELGLNFIEWSDPYTDKYFHAKDKKRVIINGLKDGFYRKKFIPLFAGSALQGDGVLEFLKFLCLVETEKQVSDASAIIFKRQIHPLLGEIVYLKTQQTLKHGDILFHKEEPIVLDKIYCMIPGGVEEVREVPENSVAAIQNNILTIGDIIYKKPITDYKPIDIDYSRELFALLIEPNSKEDKSAIEAGIKKLVWEDSGLSCDIQTDTGQWELFGMGELHLEVSINRLRTFVGEKFQIHTLKVAKYTVCKTLAKKVVFEHSTFDGKWKSGKLHGFLEARTDFDNIVEFTIDLGNLIQGSIESAFHEILSHGMDGNSVLGLQLKIESYDKPEVFDEHTPSLVKIAVISGLKLILASNSTLIGPTSFFEIIVPGNYVGGVLSLLNKRLSRIHNLDVIDENHSRIQGEASAQNLLGFTGAFRNMTQGKGSVLINTVFAPGKFSELPK